MGDEVAQAALPSGWDVLSDSAKLDKMILEMVATRNSVGETRKVLSSVVPVVNKHTEILRRHEDRIERLEGGDPAGGFLPTSELMIDNLPLDCHLVMAAKDVVTQVLNVLQIPQVYRRYAGGKRFCC